MWRIEAPSTPRIYPFRHKHSNHFPPSPERSQPSPPPFDSPYDSDEEFARFLLNEHEEIPIFYMPESHMLTPREYPLSPPLPLPLSLPKNNRNNHIADADSYPFEFPSVPSPLRPVPKNRILDIDTTMLPLPPPSPASVAPANLTSLLQDVLGIMNVIMGEQAVMEGENEALQELVELVVIMQEEAETLVDMADLVEEFVDECQMSREVSEIEEWVEDLDLRGVGRRMPAHRETDVDVQIGWRREEKRSMHEREDSGVGLDDDADEESLVSFQSGSLKEMEPVKEQRVPEYMKATRASKVRQEVSMSPPDRTKKGPGGRRPDPFRDSALGLLTPDRPGNATSRRKPPPSPRWI
ncbi:hypothetical protein BP5796_05142 [Coleophoma crateriformis]|uniref:Uncharacterized protein n=1 Tax=Coleophoma crateriformis TaxID=565419 RepID=A0A3D8S2Y9_9HELO|nr:hypothetical protein BP5796_05142 [Coleophoma crateriformis]